MSMIKKPELSGEEIHEELKKRGIKHSFFNKDEVLTMKMPFEAFHVKSAFLHTAICWPGVAGAETTMTDAKIKGLKMLLTPNGLLLESKGKKCLVPHTNVINYVLEE